MEQNYTKIDHELPLIPLRGLAIFPYMILNFDIGREISLKALDQAMMDEELIFLTSQKEADVDEPGEEDFYHVGTICKVKQMIKLPGDTVRVLVEGVSRGRVKKIEQEEGYFRAVIEEIVFDSDNLDSETEVEIEAFVRNVFDAFEEYINIGNRVSPEILISLADIEDVDRFIDTIAANIYLKSSQKQEILEEFDIKKRLELIYSILLEEIDILKIEKKITLRVKKQMNKVQKEYYLREQLKAIQKELGEEEDINSEADEYREKLKKIKAPKTTKEKIEKEIDKFSKISSMSPDVSVSRNYLDTIFSLPWNKETKDKLDIVKAQAILDEDHYGLEKVKERILEYLAIRTLAKSLKGPIICLVGPPGTGKTSIVKSIARALNRKFVRISLGGVRDEAEIRGHRRTYVGSIPGRIINGVKEAQTKNPVFLFDEIDKMAADYKGDPASAMLEVLDPEQNKDFVDHYLEIPFDLSKILFVTTANSLSNIPRPLLDRMEVIEVSGYIEEEKLNIAKQYLLPKQIKEHALKENFVKMDDETLRSIINHYTREAGVRTLERTIGKVCRKIAKKYVEDPTLEEVVVNKSDLEKYLGKDMFKYQLAELNPQIGLVNGLAWTAVGGVTLEVEVNVLKGKGEIVLTGKLGDVMKESAKTGISYIRSIVDKFDIDPDFYKTNDIHIHIPEGAVPKDGPSAGITMALAVISALTKRPVPGNIAMTGEITLRGRVLAVGGVKEKLLAAHRAGITKVLIPKECEADLDEIPENVKEKMEFVLVEHMDEVLEQALLKSGEKNEN
ncbi:MULTISPECIES: endopeptidase La [unclassified Clostridioides]|uniref:endopeptidase La n=1 Tax=unclassified Clostridioides TaxID=2635829 RepID=UPI001D0C2025|nr:endopeptidase La [Clostridioides sp. ES-S-0001-02]MCC0642333.1 endopeptidase La [Clostridioides sp. ES-S-0049-03]MCC0651025.1 endopeptidase La [Clostridioides sp. ES-S-0001-03]MCC0656211.1 endopeptidase La [Clostridioides sp. ES-S-0123-01]MCC0671462.1 endopeptidase La [Clostridioides sp. ES-S-0145-01]MCC0678316.1 endopeptidase La [Clostridioides sp. ES-W-0018-02]MCC0680975.1 endopeptidase La [Clostridioides sp. ES-S-0005-03]MCC0704732.1 endopeptidase La [Clostridioides sp. ES-S-0049-02]M